MSTIPWWAYNWHLKLFCVCLIVPISFHHFFSQIDKSSTDWENQAFLSSHAFTHNNSDLDQVFIKDLFQDITTVLSCSLLHIAESLGSYLAVWESILVLYKLKYPGVPNAMFICSCGYIDIGQKLHTESSGSYHSLVS